MQRCEDNYYVTFSSYPGLLDFHQEQAQGSKWTRCPVKELGVEPLDEASPFYEDLGAFAVGTTPEAVADTAKNLGLALRVNGELYPVRSTAYKSLLDRAKIGGTVLPKLPRQVLAETLNACLKVFPSDALVLIRDEKVSAVHSGDEVDYSILPINELIETLKKKLDERFPNNEFDTGYADHALSGASWKLPGQKEDLIGTYTKTIAAMGQTKLADKLVPGIRFMTSDTGIASAKVSALLLGGQHPIHIGGCVAVDHRHGKKISDFDTALDQLFAQFGNLNLEYGTDFKLIESPELTDSAATLVDLYMQEAALHGIDNVALLTPLRQKTETCVNALNELIRDKVNPAAPSKVETPERAGKIYREGDKVMQIKNFEDVNNGDPCLGSGPSAVRIRDMYDFAAYIVATALRINMTGQSFLSPTTRKYGENAAQMQEFKIKVREMLRKNLGDSVLDLDYSSIYDEIKENFNDQYRMYMR